MGDKPFQYPPGYARTQAARHLTWTPPPLDGSITFPEILHWHGEHSTSHPFAIIAPEHEGEEEVLITWQEVSRAIFRLAATLRQEVGNELIDGKPPVIAIQAYPETLTYATWLCAITAAGYTAFPLSPRNSPPAVEHLVKTTNCRYLIGSIPKQGEPGTALQQMAAQLLQDLPGLKLIELPQYDTLYPRFAQWPPLPYNPVTDSVPTIQPSPARKDAPTLIIHSSGSTAFPKPIPLNDDAWNTWGQTQLYQDADVCETRGASLTLPMFHIAGLAMTLSSAVWAGTIAIFFKPAPFPTIPTPQNVLHAAQLGKADFLFAVPSAYVEWAQDPKAVAALAKFSTAKYGGGPIPEEFGHRLVEGGVKLQSAYGMTEVGPVFRGDSVSWLGGRDWMYAPFMPNVKVKLIDEGDNLFRAETDTYKGVAVSNYEAEVRAFDTNDLLEEHPTRKGYWKVVGRADDQIMMSNGEKTNPGPLESIINSSHHVQSASMFGRARTQVGVLIEPRQPINIKDDAEVARFRNLVWPEIEKANAFAPQHSRIFKEFILVADPVNKPVPRTPKGTVSRNALLKLYAEEIEAIYTAAEHPTRADWAVPPVVNGVMRSEKENAHSVDEKRDLFEQGCDSLQATYIRAAIANALREAPIAQGKNKAALSSVPQNMVFLYPTVERLVSFVLSVIQGQSVEGANNQDTIVQQMVKMANDYSQSLPPSPIGPKSDKGEVVLLTGSTGTLGSYILEQLLDDARVTHIYALNRASAGKDLRCRQIESLVDRAVNAQIRSSLTAVIHNAWRLDFNLALSSFESHVKGTRTLVDLALSASVSVPAKFIFTSTVGTVSNWRESRAVPEEVIPDPTVALGNGYGESKWVTERVLLAAAEQRGLRTTIWRVGQLSGSSVNGAWNTTDWVPIIAKSSATLGVLPSSSHGFVDWLPTDDAARVIVDSLHTPLEPHAKFRYLNLVHPNPTSWDDIFAAMSKELGVPLIPFQDWVAQVEQESAAGGRSAAERIPAIKLLDFFRRIVSGGSPELGGSGSPARAGQTQFETTNAVQVSETLRTLQRLNEDDVERWLQYWRKHSLFD
ncbi:acetyl-CoA synthetase-like protein [Calocera viscosa TUFC12733]|uniref:Acetyl-CoA synthetase-like protein n=1 Tax=Calocera viscosa (strain TUFC12733) TaxID=1330018 RepID=A0A167JSX8_CALVF|nr:acetyl-CoA synthetase-like protein [Calocera viscosa TUFC12733]